MSGQQRKPKTRARSRTQPVPMSSTVATVLLLCLCIFLFGLVGGIILYTIGKLPSLLTEIVSSVYTVATAIIVTLTAIFGNIGSRKSVSSSFYRVWKSAKRRLSLALGFIIALGVTLALTFSNQIPGIAVGSTLLPNTSPAAVSVLKSASYPLLLKQVAPHCNDPKGTTWYVHQRGTYLSCSATQLLMQRISSQFFAGMELVEVNGSTYNQTSFSVQVEVTFQNPSDTNTIAALLVQTPAAVNEVGGLYFTLNSQGDWQLREIFDATNIPIIDHGSVTIDPSKPVLMMVKVHNDDLGGYINGKLVEVYNDNLNPLPGQVGLYNLGPKLSAPVLYSNFVLDA